MGDGLRTAGGLDGIGATGVGWINARRDAVPKITGLYDDQTANYPVDSVHYCIFVDLNGDGDYGTYDKATRQFAPDPDEFAVVNQVAGFSPFHAGGEPLSAGEIVAYYADPIAEPTALTLSGINCGPGVSDSANVVALSVVSEPANSWFFVHYCTNLLASNWTDINPNGYFPVENTTTVYHTNVMPTVFYRVSSAPAH
jgi:hypothetical protein